MDDVRLRPVAGADLSVLERLTQDPASTGEFAWLGWHNLTGMHRKAEEEPIAELLATTTPRGPTRLPIPPSGQSAQQAE